MIFGSNTFINVPTILQVDDTPLVSVVKEQGLGYTTEIPIHHADGTYLTKVRGTRVYPTDAGKAAGVKIERHPQLWVCTSSGRTAFEIRQQPGDAFTLTAELYTPTGYFVKVSHDSQPQLFDASGDGLQIGGLFMTGNTLQGCRIGIWIQSSGQLSICCG